MKETYIFLINGSWRYAQEAVSYNGNDYAARIIPESFSGIDMRVDIVSKLHAPSQCSFDIENVDDASVASNYEGVSCLVSLLKDGVFSRSWAFIINTAVPYGAKIRCNCVDPVTYRLDGEFPEKPTIKANFPSDQVLQDTEFRVPVTYGTAFIPCPPFLKSGVNYFCLGPVGYTYTISNVRTPRGWDYQSSWDNSYTYTQSNQTGELIQVRGVRLYIADTDSDGTADAYGVWPKSGNSLAPLIQFSGAYPTLTLPGGWLWQLLRDFRLNSAELDESTFDAVDTALSGVTWGGGWWKSQAKEGLLASILSQCDCFLSVEEKVKLNQFSASSVETFDRSKILENTYSASKITKSASDGGTIRFAWDGEPQDILSGEATVPLYTGQSSIVAPSKDVFEYAYGYDNTEAQKFGQLYFQKKFDQKYSVSFKSLLSEITARDTLIPGQVITIDDDPSGGIQLYGTSQKMVITALHFNPDGSVDIQGTVYNHLEDYSDLTASEIISDTDGGGDFEFNSLSQIVAVSGQTIFHYVAGASVPDETSIVLTAELFGSLTTYDWEYWDGSAWVNLSGTQDAKTYTLAYNNAAWSGDTLRIRCLSGDYYGEITIVKMYDGVAGADGADGEDLASWSSDIIFSSTDYNTVAWGSGNLYAFGDTYAINAGNTGNMTGVTYIYYQPSYSLTTLRTTTSAGTSVGTGKLLVAVAGVNSDSTAEAPFQVFGGKGGLLLTADNIAANSITANLLYSNLVSGMFSSFGTMEAGVLRSANWAAAAGMQIDLDNATFEVREPAGLLIMGGADITLNTNGVNAGLLKFITDNGEIASLGPNSSADEIELIPLAASNRILQLSLGSPTTNEWLTINLYSRNSISLKCPTGTLQIESNSIQVDSNHIYGTGYPNIGSTTTSLKFGYGYFVYDLSCRALVLTSSITGATNITGSGTVTGGSFSSGGNLVFTSSGSIYPSSTSIALNIGTTTLRVRNVYAQTQFRLYNGSGSGYAALTTNFASTGGTEDGYWAVNIGGTTRYVRLHATA